MKMKDDPDIKSLINQSLKMIRNIREELEFDENYEDYALAASAISD